MRVGASAAAPYPPRRHRPSRRYQVAIELTARQAELLLFFANDRGVGSVRVQTIDALIGKGLIRLEESTRKYRITELGHAVAAVVVRRA